jgi:exodeoxyribonuclease VII small subunit
VPAKKRSEPSTSDTAAGRAEPGGETDGGSGADVPGAVEGLETVEALETVEGLDSLSYEQARDELVDVVRRLEAGGASLEDSLALWERGEALAARCQTWLDGARARLDAVRATP